MPGQSDQVGTRTARQRHHGIQQPLRATFVVKMDEDRLVSHRATSFEFWLYWLQERTFAELTAVNHPLA